MTPEERSFIILRIVTWSYVAFLFAVLPVTPGLVKMAEQIIPVGTCVNGVAVVLMAGSCFFLIRTRPEKRTRIVLASAVLGGFLALTFAWIRIPIERVHVVEYAVLSFLFFQLFVRKRAALPACFFAFFLAAAIGILDESIQLILPNRFFAWRDIALNLLGGFFGLATAQLRNSGIRRR